MSPTARPEQTQQTGAQPVDTADRLNFTLFLALALHALLILGVSFTLPEPDSAAPTLDVTLASHKALDEPEQADYLAQHNQQASGTQDQAQELTAEQEAEFADTRVRDINPLPQQRAASPRQQQKQNLVDSQGANQRKTRPEEDPEPQEQQRHEGLVEEQPVTQRDIASLQAKLDRQRQEYAKRPRIRRLTSMATRASFEAEYLHQWSQKIERTGNRHYPQEALKRRLTGELRLAVALKPNGTLHNVEILQSSGHRILDQAAVQIVHLAAPFQAFPAEMRREYDRLEIIRTWQFEISGLSTSAQ